MILFSVAQIQYNSFIGARVLGDYRSQPFALNKDLESTFVAIAIRDKAGGKKCVCIRVCIYRRVNLYKFKIRQYVQVENAHYRFPSSYIPRLIRACSRARAYVCMARSRVRVRVRIGMRALVGGGEGGGGDKDSLVDS